MILKSARLLASKGASATADHVFRGNGNDRIVIIQGSELMLDDMVSDARGWRRTYAIRHWKLNPLETPTRAQLDEAVTVLAEEFAFDTEDAVIVGHVKRRADDAGSPYHLHVLVPEVNPATGRVLSDRWSYARQEKLSRVLEVRWGHQLVQGRFNKLVLETLAADGLPNEAKELAKRGLDPEARPNSQVRDGLGPELSRKTSPGLDTKGKPLAGRSMAEVIKLVAQARRQTAGPEAFNAALADKKLRCVPGSKRGRWVVEAQTVDGSWVFAGSLDRLLRVKVAEANSIMLGIDAMLSATDTGNNDAEKNEEQPTGSGARADREDIGSARLRRPAGGNARRGNLEASRPQRDDTDNSSSARQRQSGAQADVAVRRTRGGERAQPPRGAVGGNTGAAAYEWREAGRNLGSVDDGSTTDCAQHGGQDAGRSRRLKRILFGASLEQHFRKQHSADALRAMLDTVRQPIIVPGRGTQNRTVRCGEDPKTLRERRLRFRAMLLRRAYHLADHLPLAAVINLRRVDTDPDGKYVLLTLQSGTQLLDTGDRITVKGHPDDVAINELVACCARRGWTAVEVDGDHAFRIAASRELMRQGIEVVDCPLSLQEQIQLRAEADGSGYDWADVKTAPAYAPRPPWLE